MCAVRLLLRDFKKSKIMFYTFKMRGIALVAASNHPSRRSVSAAAAVVVIVVLTAIIIIMRRNVQLLASFHSAVIPTEMLQC